MTFNSDSNVKNYNYENMFLKQFYHWKCLAKKKLIFNISFSTVPEYNLHYLCKYLNIDKDQAKYLQIKQPVIKNFSEEKIKKLIETVNKIGLSNIDLVSNPALFGILPITLKFRTKVLQECGLQEITPAYLLSYLTLVKKITIGTLKKDSYILHHVNIENRLASYMTQWPTSLTTLVHGDVNSLTLYSLRLKIIQRYLELVLDISSDEFYRGLETYPTIKHRPLEIINTTLNILQTQIQMPSSKIKSNLYLIHADPDNLKDLIYQFRSIGGIDIKEVIRLHPKIAMKNYSTMLEIRKVLEEFNVSNEAQIRCFEIYTLSPLTIRERLEKARTTPEFLTYFNHPRFLKMIHYNKTATTRLMKLYGHNKKCLSLNVLSGSSAHFETFEKAPGDRLGKGKDLVFCISHALEKTFDSSDIRNLLKRHPFWINIPLVQVKFVCDQLLKQFSVQDIYDNCQIVLYPWRKIKDLMDILNQKKTQHHFPIDHLDLVKLTKSQKLSLILYFLEKNHYFIGNGVWFEDKNKNVVESEKENNKITPIECNNNNMSK